MQHTLSQASAWCTASLAMSLKQAGGSSANDFVQVLDTAANHKLTFSALGWA